jgi:chemotaxis protein histidine kinase CheA
VTRLFRLWLPLSAFLSAPALAQDAAVMNTITKVAVKSGVVEITGTQKPSFSTFPMTDPPRLVVDISQAVFSGVPEAIDVASGHIVAIKTASYGSSASAIARVVIGFDREVEPDIQTVGNKLVVRAAPAPGGAAVATAAPVSSPAGRLSDTPAAAAPAQDTSSTASAAAAAASEKQRQDAATAAAQEKQRQDAAAAAALAADKQRQDASALAAAAADKRRQDAATAAAAVAEKQRQDAAAAAAAAAERRRLDEAAATAAAEDQRRHEDAAAAARAEEKRRQEASAAAAAEEQRRQQEAATARTREEKQQAAAQAAAAEETRKKEAALAATAAENRRRQDGAAAAAAEQRRQTEAAQAAEQRRQQDTKVASLAEARGRQDLLVVAPTARATTAVATTAGPHPATPAEPVTIEGAGSSGGTEANSRRKALTFVGFDEKGPRVYVRTNGPVRYSVSTGTKNTVVVELDNTSIPLHNNSRALDTAFFAGPVLRIQPERGPKNSVRVAITLRDGVAYQAHQDGNEVSVQFRAP